MTKFFLYIYFAITLATVFVIDKQLANGVVCSKYFWFYGSMGLISIATVIQSLTKKQEFRFSLSDGFVFLFVGSVFLSALVFNDASANATKLVILVLLSVLYVCLRLILNANRHILCFFCFFIILTGLVEAIWGMMQLHGFRPSQHSLFKLTGSFFNPGPYSGYLAVVFPMALYCFLKNNNQQIAIKSVSIDAIKNWLITVKIQTVADFLIPFVKKWLGGITCIAILLVLPAGMSRASWLAAVGGCGVVMLEYLKRDSAQRHRDHKGTRRNIIRVAAVSGVLLAGCAGMYYLKKDSADGRLLTWKVSLSAVIKNPLGVGLGHFPNAYGEAQAAYFASGKATETEEYVAGNPEYGFNEFLQIAIESGIVSLLLFIGMLVSAFRELMKSRNWGVTGALVSLLVFACFSYPFSVLPFLIVFVFLLAISGSTQSTQIKRSGADFKSTKAIFVSSGCLIVTAFCLWKQYPVYDAFRQWKNNQMYYQTGMYSEAAGNCEPLYPYLNDQIKFLFEYGHSLSQSEQPEKSNEVLQHATQISCDPMLYNIIGKNYQAMHEYDLAEQSLQKSALIVPNRIYPYYLLTHLYIETGDTVKAKEMAQLVLTKEPKVQSTAIREMRSEMKRLFP